MSRKQRRTIMIDRQFQMQYFKIWLLVGVGVVLVAGGFYFISRWFQGTEQRVDPIIIRMLTGVGIFVVLYSALMGLLSVALTHRVAGAAWRLEQWTRKVLEGEPQGDVTLRKGDYLQTLAQLLNQFKNSVEQNRALTRELLAQLELLRGKTGNAWTEEERRTFDDLQARLKSFAYPSNPHPE